jgi:uncharacterized membrane protein YphA (DoxX/SURF4 family)
MQSSNLTHVSFVSRLLLGFLFIYHGLVPKILWLSATEIQLVNVSGLGISAQIASPIAGLGEIVLGFMIIFNKTILPIYIAALVLLLLLLFVVFTSPQYLIEAFNPVTTNILGLGLCYLIVFCNKHKNVF